MDSVMETKPIAVVARMAIIVTCAACGPASFRREQTEAATPVSLAQLCASPSNFDGRVVRVTGTMRCCFEDHSFYDASRQCANRGIWIGFDPRGFNETRMHDWNGLRATIIGTFHADGAPDDIIDHIVLVERARD